MGHFIDPIIVTQEIEALHDYLETRDMTPGEIKYILQQIIDAISGLISTEAADMNKKK